MGKTTLLLYSPVFQYDFEPCLKIIWKVSLRSFKSGKGKVVSVLKQAPCHKDVVGEWKCRSTHSLNLAIDGDEGSAPRPSRFTSRERAPATHLIGGWVGPRVGLDMMSKRKIPSPRWDSNLNHPIVQPVLSRYTD
jgi:hypothetical protein